VANWDEDSQQLRANLAEVLEDIVKEAERREIPTLLAARRWQMLVMRGLSVTETRFVGSFRGQLGLESVQVSVGANFGVAPAEVPIELAVFEKKLQGLVAQLDALLPVGQEPDGDQLAAIIDLCAWAHAEWVRIHPFANGNGRTARLWAHCIAMRYGLPPFIRLRPRPDTRYAEAGTDAMRGNWKPTVVAFRKLLDDFLNPI
jgi:hypothetical protein